MPGLLRDVVWKGCVRMRLIDADNGAEIEIVKQGAVCVASCEYFVKDEEIYAGCNKKAVASAFCWFNECGDYKYCPYCGKKIKVVDSNDV